MTHAERLRSMAEDCGQKWGEDNIDACLSGAAAIERVEEIEKEMERLRKEVARWESDDSSYGFKWRQAEAHIERLRSELAEQRSKQC